jgi:hypothetical protein
MRALIALLLLALSLSMSYAQDDPPPWADQQQRLISAHLPKNKFSALTASMSIDGNLAAVGTYYSTEQWIGLGAVVIFERSGEFWTEQAFILPPVEDRVNDYQFGLFVELSGDYLGVVAHATNDPGWFPDRPQNALYIYKRNGQDWLLEAKFMRIPDMNGSYISGGFRFVGGKLFIPTYRKLNFSRSNNTEVAGYVYERVEGVWSLSETIFRPDIPELSAIKNWGASLLNNGNVLAITTYRGQGYTFRRTAEGWQLSGTIQPPNIPPTDNFHWDFDWYSIHINDPGDNAVVYWEMQDNCEIFVDCQGIDIYHLDESGWHLEHRAFTIGTLGAITIHNDTVVLGSATMTWTNAQSSSIIFNRVDGRWIKQSTLAVYEPPTKDMLQLGASYAVQTDGTYVLTTLEWWDMDHNPDQMSSSAVYAIKIPGVNQDAPQTVGKANAALLSVPPASDAVREIGSSDYASVNVSLKTRPTQKVILQLSTNGSALLDVGGTASQVINITFTRKNWNVPRPVRVRLAPGQSGPLSAVIREKVIDGSAFEYKLVRPLSVRVEVPGLTFALDTPAPDAVFTNDAPVTFTWRPYSLATRYVVKLKRTGSTRLFRYPVDPAAACTLDLCSLTLDRAALPRGTAFKWHVVAQDQPAAFSRATTWRKFTFTPPQ